MFVIPLAHRSLRPYRQAVRRLDSAPPLARVIDRLFDDLSQPVASTAAVVRTPALDVDETDTHYLLSFDLPGVAKDALKVSIEGRRVRIETEAAVVAAPAATETNGSASAAPAAETVAAPAPRNLYRERSGVVYARTVSLPQEVDSEASEARLDNGVLTLRLAKRHVDGARHLTVN